MLYCTCACIVCVHVQLQSCTLPLFEAVHSDPWMLCAQYLHFVGSSSALIYSLNHACLCSDTLALYICNIVILLTSPSPFPSLLSPLQTDTHADWDAASKMLHGRGQTGTEFDVFMLYSFTPSLQGYSYKVGGAPVS